jgi:hypothetical protein
MEPGLYSKWNLDLPANGDTIKFSDLAVSPYNG